MAEPLEDVTTEATTTEPEGPYPTPSPDSYFIFTLNDDGASYSVKAANTDISGDIVIPKTHNGLPVTTIGEGAFSGCYNLTSIEIPNSVMSISKNAFYGCTSLESITIESGNPVYHSDGNCLIETASKKLVAGCKNSVIPDDGSVTIIGDNAFGGYTSLMHIEIPNSVTNIGESAFQECSSLTSITIPSTVTSIGMRAFFFCTSLTSIAIPNSVTKIEYGTFWNCDSITNVIIPNSVTYIGTYVFYGCESLTSIEIPNSVTSIGEKAFSYCTSLTSIIVEAGNPVYQSAGNCLIKTASKTLVAGCKNSVIPDDGSVTKIGEYAFYWCKNLESITIPDSVMTIGNYAFRNCEGLTSITIPSSVTSIGSEAFFACRSLTDITYTGTMAQWEAITKGDDWDGSTVDHIAVHCIDGEIMS